MTIQEFANVFDLKKIDTILDWLEKGYIQGATCNKGVWAITELDRPPYTNARAKTTTAIYKSIVKACVKRKGVNAKLYKLVEEEFHVYIRDLEEEGLISIIEKEGIFYYYATTKANEYLSQSKKLDRLIKGLVASASLVPVAIDVAKNIV